LIFLHSQLMDLFSNIPLLFVDLTRIKHKMELFHILLNDLEVMWLIVILFRLQRVALLILNIHFVMLLILRIKADCSRRIKQIHGFVMISRIYRSKWLIIPSILVEIAIANICVPGHWKVQKID
jgi:hypothetical protein